jgi:hypothetical protein
MNTGRKLIRISKPRGLDLTNPEDVNTWLDKYFNDNGYKSLDIHDMGNYWSAWVLG